MFEILMIAGVVISLVQINRQNGRLDQLKREIGDLKGEIKALHDKQGLPEAAPDLTLQDAVADEIPEVPEDVASPVSAMDTTEEVPLESLDVTSATEAAPAENPPVEQPEADITAKDIPEPAVRPAQMPVEPAIAARSAARSAESLESRLGARWTVWVGGLALAFGGLFMVKYSIENGLISPALRLVLAAMFGLALMACGEAVRRRIGAFASATFQNAMIPGVLTAAGSLTLMGSIFVAHSVYAYLGSTTAFILLSFVSLATVGLSLMHGQALAGLGLLAAFVTPLLVRSTEPNAWALFTFLTIAWFATTLACRIREWKIVAMLANLGLAFWAIAFLVGVHDGVWPITLAVLVMIAGTAFIWPGSDTDVDIPVQVNATSGISVPSQDGEASAPAEPLANAPGPATFGSGFASLLAVVTGPYLPNFATLAFGTFVVGTNLIAIGTGANGLPDNPVYAYLLIVAALAGLGFYRLQAVLSTLAAAALTLTGFLGLIAAFWTTWNIGWNSASTWVTTGTVFGVATVVTLIFIGLGFARTLMAAAHHRQTQVLSALLSVAVAMVVWLLAYGTIGDLNRDWTFAGVTLIIGLVYLAAAEILHRRPDEATSQPSSNPMIAIYVTGSALAFLFAIHTVTSGIVTTLLVAVLGFAYVLATRIRPWAILPWMMGLVDVVVMARIGWNPSIVAADALSTTPFFNALLPGYGIPALLTAIAAYDLRHWPNASIRNFLQALASLGVLLTIAILVRHAMNGGVLDSTVPTLGEQSVYTLLSLGASAVLMTLDIKAPSPVFRWASMAIGVVSMASVLIAHLIVLNPLLTGENQGAFPVVDLLLVGYFLPALAALGLAWYAEGKRPSWYRTMITVTGLVLLFVWVPLEIHHLFENARMVRRVELMPAEVYLWPLCWLALSFGLAELGKYLEIHRIRTNGVAVVDTPFGVAMLRASLAFSAATMISLMLGNLVVCNPYLFPIDTGDSAIFNLLLLGFFIPAIAILLRALYGRRRNEARLFVLAPSVVGLVLLLAYITLMVRHFWHGAYVEVWSGFQQGETYTYSVVWLMFGIVLLVLGSRLNAISLRLASAAVVFLTVVKVFLFDMSSLEGILRALSFIGLGIVLIAIGMFYQRLLGNMATRQAKTEDAQIADTNADPH
jgi:uncharacterized membrane protein